MLRLLSAFRYAQPIRGGLRLRRNTRCYPLPASMRDRIRAAEWVERSETKSDQDRRTAPGMAHSEHALGAAHRSNIREWYCDHAPARIPGRLTSSRPVGSARSVIFCQRDPHRAAVWLV